MTSCDINKDYDVINSGGTVCFEIFVSAFYGRITSQIDILGTAKHGKKSNINYFGTLKLLRMV